MHSILFNFKTLQDQTCIQHPQPHLGCGMALIEYLFSLEFLFFS